jgi:hypothetical protein
LEYQDVKIELAAGRMAFCFPGSHLTVAAAAKL